MGNGDEHHRKSLELAQACAAGDPLARVTFERDHLAAVADHLTAIDRSPSFVERVRAALAAELLGAGRIKEYTGKVPLSAWVRVAALRTALALRRGQSDGAPTQTATDEREVQRETGEQAVEQALREISTRERMVLRLTLAEGMDAARVGAIYGVPAATVVGWVEEARRRIRERTPSAVNEAAAGTLLVRLLRED
jgi:RNA polymerase sigma-70 factor (ECF subfamily)